MLKLRSFILPVIIGLSSVSHAQPTGNTSATKVAIDDNLSAQEILEKDLAKLKHLEESLKLTFIQQNIQDLGLPLQNGNENIVWHKALALSYNEKHEQANWVMHQIIPDIKNGNFSRSNDFRTDSAVSSGTAFQDDYYLVKKDPSGKTVYDGFGYDRGHLAPSADFRWSATALSESYFYSNMSPQDPLLNREKWAELEAALRGYVIRKEHALFIVTGPVLTDNLKKITRAVNGLSIPKLFFKVVYDPTEAKSIAFLMPNGYCKQYLRKYAVSIDSVESLTGINFFPNIKDTSIEAQRDAIYWMPKEAQGDVLPISEEDLPKRAINTNQAQERKNDGNKHRVCGTVVSSKQSGKGNVFLNLDRSFPNHVFSVTIWRKDVSNFSYKPDIYLMRKEVCVTGKIGDYQGVPSMNINKEEAINIIGE